MDRTLHSMGISVTLKSNGDVSYLWRDDKGIPHQGSRLSKIPSPWSRQFRQLLRDRDVEVHSRPGAPDTFTP